MVNGAVSTRGKYANRAILTEAREITLEVQDNMHEFFASLLEQPSPPTRAQTLHYYKGRKKDEKNIRLLKRQINKLYRQRSGACKMRQRRYALK